MRQNSSRSQKSLKAAQNSSSALKPHHRVFEIRLIRHTLYDFSILFYIFIFCMNIVIGRLIFLLSSINTSASPFWTYTWDMAEKLSPFSL